MKRNIFYIFLIIGLFLALNFFIDITAPNVQAKCPEDYPETEVGFAERKIATDKWITDFRKRNPNGSLVEVAKARYEFYLENECNTTLQKLSEAEAEEAESEEEKIIRETIQEEINDQAIENLINALKDN